MFDALNTAATGMEAQAKQVEVISNNLANTDTVGFKRSRAEFQDLLYNTVKEPGAATSATTSNPTGVQIGMGVKVGGVTKMFEQGAPRHTGNDQDVMIEGNGFFAVQLPNGELNYTRDGGFRLGATGRLETVDGYAVMPEITVPQDAVGMSIAADGRVSIRNGAGEVTELGQLQLTTFANPAGLSSQGGNLYSATSASGAPVVGNAQEPGFGRLLHQYLESATVKPVEEMTSMIKAQRIYEMNSKIINTTDQMMSTLNQIR